MSERMLYLAATLALAAIALGYLLVQRQAARPGPQLAPRPAAARPAAPPPLPTARTRVGGWSVWPGQWWLERRFRQAENPIISPEIVVRTSLQKRVGGYDVQLPKAADMEMFMRLAANAGPCLVQWIRSRDVATASRGMSRFHWV